MSPILHGTYKYLKKKKKTPFTIHLKFTFKWESYLLTLVLRPELCAPPCKFMY